MRHQKGRRDCSYNSSLRCLSFTRCLSAILCPIFLENKLHSFVFLTESAVWLSSLPCCCLPAPLCLSPLKPTHTLKLMAPGFAFSLNQPARPSRFPSAPWEAWAELRPLRSSARCSRGGSSLSCLPASGTALGTGSLVGGPGDGGLWLVRSSVSFLLPDTLGSPLFSALQSPLL